ncbi:MAG: DUF2064 domain-containing protein [Candidatus Hydrothermarchaeales archaeon]
MLIFAKVPERGKVKTRLKKTSPLTDDDLLQLYTAFLMDTIITASNSKADAIFLSYLSSNGDASIDAIIENCRSTRSKKIVTFPQVGDNFDARFTYAVKKVSETTDGNIVVIGSDSPHLQPKVIDEAFDFLAEHGGMVLGPSGEGGVYLLGLKGGSPIDLEGVFTYGVEIENLVKIAKEKRMPLSLLGEVTDVDVISDLVTLICNLNAMSYSSKFEEVYLPKNTIEVVENLGLRIVGSEGGIRGRKIVKL